MIKNYIPSNCVWEMTYACNMHCKHCGSGCGEKYADELTEEEALALCDSLAKTGFKIVTLSGGEPFMRKDWDIIAQRLSSLGIKTNVISNGWFIDDKLVKRALASGILNMGISLDGLRETHDDIRKKGSFDHVMNALDVLNNNGMPSVICTSINTKNIRELPGLLTILLEKKVQRWQFQIASPMGNLLHHKELIISPHHIDTLIDFAYDTIKNYPIIIDLADDIGYFNEKEMEIRRYAMGTDKIRFWKGCNGGKCVIGITANGNINPCLSIRDPGFIEANIREKDLYAIWTDENAFSCTRSMKKSDLTGFCRTCQYGSYCLGGCTGAKITLSGTLYENRYCSFRHAVEKEEIKIKRITDYTELMEKARSYITDEMFQLADLYLKQAEKVKPGQTGHYDLLGYVHFSMENYEQSRVWNEKSIEKNPLNAYAYKGLGLCLVRMEDRPGGIAMLEKAIELAPPGFTDPYYDLALVYIEGKETAFAKEVLEKGFSVSESFKKEHKELYNSLKD
ncbi:MAG: radical SAM protein [Spirochaetales bacterium]|nr:radical SAM protein [Spirochaetales bacterium]